MTVILKSAETLGAYGRICAEKNSRAFTVQVYFDGMKVYENLFQDYEKAKRALNRNVKSANKKYM